MAHGRGDIVQPMKTVDRPLFSERVDRFLRWFFTASPDVDVVLPSVPTSPRSRTVSHHKPARVRPQHGGPVRVAVKAKR